MISDEEINTLVAPSLKSILDAGYIIRYMDGDMVAYASEELGIKIKYFSDLSEWSEYQLNARHLKLWSTPPSTIKDLMDRFTVVVPVGDFIGLID